MVRYNAAFRKDKVIKQVYSKILYDKLGYVPNNRPYVFGIGLSKTGTTSLNEALNILGIASLHLPPTTVINSKGNIEFSWPWWLSKYRAATDISISAIFEILFEKFPKAKFIYTERELEGWLISCRKHFSQNLMEKRILQNNRWVIDLTNAFYGSNVYDKDMFKKTYENFNYRVDNFFRNKELLRLNIIEGDGWEPLCKFLDKQIPNIPFPKSNAGKKMHNIDGNNDNK